MMCFQLHYCCHCSIQVQLHRASLEADLDRWQLEEHQHWDSVAMDSRCCRCLQEDWEVLLEPHSRCLQVRRASSMNLPLILLLLLRHSSSQKPSVAGTVAYG